MKALFFLLTFFLFSCQTGEKKRRANNHHVIGISLLKKCDPQSALGQLRKAVSYQSNNPVIRHSLGSAYFFIKKYALAKKEFRTVLDQEPQLTEALLSLALSNIELNQIQAAFKNLRQAEADLTYPGISKILNYRAYAYYKDKKYALARQTFKKIKSTSKENICFNQAYLGKTEFYLRNYEEAEKILKKALSTCQKANQNKRYCLNPHPFEEHYFLGKIYKQRKDNKRARYHFKLFIKRTDSSNPYFSRAKRELRL